VAATHLNKPDDRREKNDHDRQEEEEERLEEDDEREENDRQEEDDEREENDRQEEDDGQEENNNQEEDNGQEEDDKSEEDNRQERLNDERSRGDRFQQENPDFGVDQIYHHFDDDENEEYFSADQVYRHSDDDSDDNGDDDDGEYIPEEGEAEFLSEQESVSNDDQNSQLTANDPLTPEEWRERAYEILTQAWAPTCSCGLFLSSFSSVGASL
jgi:hypothetical protein